MIRKKKLIKKKMCIAFVEHLVSKGRDIGKK